MAVDVLGDRRTVARSGLAAAVPGDLAELPALVPARGVRRAARPRHRPPRPDRAPDGTHAGLGTAGRAGRRQQDRVPAAPPLQPAGLPGRLLTGGVPARLARPGPQLRL